jgi:hypothetical protein
MSNIKDKYPKLNYWLNNNLLINYIWYVVPLFAGLLKTVFDPCNNYLIYKGVFYHTLRKTNLYDFYPTEFADKNHYGIIYSLIIAPFTFLPNAVSIVIYQAIQLYLLNYVIRKLPLSALKQNLLLLFILLEALANCQNVQINTFIAFVMVGAYVWIHNKQEMKAAFVTMLGFFVKLYGIVGLGLFFFVKRKPIYILALIGSSIILYLLPLFITNFDFLNQSYLDWFVELQSKNGTNSDLENIHQNMSAIGFFMKISRNNTFNILYIVLPAFIFQLLPLVRYKLFQHQAFQMKYLASLMMFIILFNTATETSTFIIGTTGAGIWWLNNETYTSKKILWFMAFVLFLGTISTTDLVPKYFNVEVVRKYSLKAFPYLIVWCCCIYQLVFSKFDVEPKKNLCEYKNNHCNSCL